MKTITPQQALAKLAAYCSKAEHCVHDVQKKLEQWGLSPETHEEIISYLIHEKYIDQTRYCRAFIRDKSEFAKWGEKKICYGLRNKGIDSETIRHEWEEYCRSTDTKEGLTALLTAKNRQIKAANGYDRKLKLIRFALGRGFSYEEVLPLVEHLLSNCP